MNHYGILRNTGHNQVFYQVSGQLAMAELSLLGLPLENIRLQEKAGLEYLCFHTEDALQPQALEAIARLSCLMGLFATEGESLDCLHPVALPSVQVLDRSLGTILKYSGKTNEIFTRFLLNLAYAQGGFSPKDCTVLDPVAGRGTTLFEAFALGSEVYGVEYQEKAVMDGYLHLKKFLEKGKYKHKCDSIRFSGPNKSFMAKRYIIHLLEKETQKEMQKETQNAQNSHKLQREFQLVSGDSKYCGQLFQKNQFHIILGDLPYGVQHGNQAGGITRSPAQLLASCGRAWHTVLKPNGVLVLSWNTLVFSREKMEDALERQGFMVEKQDLLLTLGHPVDASIYRDVVVARKA